MKTGMFGTSESFVPIKDAALVDDHLEVPYPKSTIKDAPNVDVDAGGHLSERGAPSLRALRHRVGRRLAAGQRAR